MVAAQAGSAIVRTALTGVLAPVGVAALVLAASARPWRGRAAPAHPAGPPLALALAFLATYVATHGWPRLAATTLRDELVWSGLALGLLGALLARRDGLLLRLQTLPALLIPYFLLDFQRERHWGRSEGILWSAGLTLLLFLSWSLCARREAHRNSPTLAIGWTLATSLAAGAYALSGSVQIAQLGGGLAAALGVASALGLWRRAAALGPAGVAPFVGLYLGLTWCGRFISELSLPSFVLLSLAPLSVLLARLVPSARVRLAYALEIALPALCALAALLVERAQATPSPYGY